jgi:signal peptidase I
VEYNFEKRYRLIREIIETIVLTVLMFIVINLAVQNYDVSGPSMEPSLHDQERIMVDKVSYMFHPPARGDVIVFDAPPAHGENYVKRIIGVPGDVISVNGTTVTVDGTTLNETYVDPIMQGNPNPPINNEVIPDGKYFVMGDDRRNSSDSRVWGFVPRGSIIGRAALVYWPFGKDNTGFLPNVSSVFANVHQPPTSKAPKSQPSAQIHSAPTFLSTGVAAMALGGAPALLLLLTSGRKQKKS